MNSQNIAKIDGKGRILIPQSMRDALNVNKGSEIILVSNTQKNKLSMFPLIKDKTAKISLEMIDTPGSLANIANVLVRYGINIIKSESRSIMRSKRAQWNILVDITRCTENLDKIKEKLLESKCIKKIKISR